MLSDRMQRVVQAGIKRRNPAQENAEEMNEHQNKQTNWRGTCQYCKSELTGTVAELLAHRCAEFEASHEQSC